MKASERALRARLSIESAEDEAKAARDALQDGDLRTATSMMKMARLDMGRALGLGAKPSQLTRTYHFLRGFNEALEKFAARLPAPQPAGRGFRGLSAASSCGCKRPTARSLEARLQRDALAYHKGRISYEEHGRRNHATWGEIKAAGLTDEVSRILRSRPITPLVPKRRRCGC